MQIKLAKVSGAKGYQIRTAITRNSRATVLRTLRRQKLQLRSLTKKKPIGLRQELTK